MSFLIMFITLLSIIFVTTIMPYITRKTESFGVTIPEEVYEDVSLVKLRKRYVYYSSSMGILILIVSCIIFKINENWFDSILFADIILILFISFLIYLQSHKKMKLLKKVNGWVSKQSQTIVIDTNFHHQKKIYSSYWFIIPLVITFITIIMTILFYKRMPGSIPMQYDIKGNVSNWQEKTYISVMQLPMIQLFMTCLLSYVNHTISKSKQQIDTINPEQSMKKNIIFRRRWSLFTLISSSLIVSYLFIIQLSLLIQINGQLIQLLGLMLIVGIIVTSIFISIATGQGGSRIKTNSNEQKNEVMYDDDQFWKLGIFYFNPNDPSVWVEKRFGSGWTMNMARPIGWIVLFIVLLIPIVIEILI